MFAPIMAIRKKHERCDEIDALRLRRFATYSLQNVPEPTPDEGELLKRALAYDVADDQYTRVSGSLKNYPTVQSKSKQSARCT